MSMYAPSPAGSSSSRMSCGKEKTPPPTKDELDQFAEEWNNASKPNMDTLRRFFRAFVVDYLHRKDYDRMIRQQCKVWVEANIPPGFPAEQWRNPNDGKDRPKKAELRDSVNRMVTIYRQSRSGEVSQTCPSGEMNISLPAPEADKQSYMDASKAIMDDVAHRNPYVGNPSEEKMKRASGNIDSGIASFDDIFEDLMSLERDYPNAPKCSTQPMSVSPQPRDHRYDFTFPTQQSYAAGPVTDKAAPLQQDGPQQSTLDPSGLGLIGYSASQLNSVDPQERTLPTPMPIPGPTGEQQTAGEFDFTMTSSFETKYPDEFRKMMEMLGSGSECEEMDTRSPPASPRPGTQPEIPVLVWDQTVDD